MTPTISVILTTIRPHLWRRAYDSIEGASGDVPYEVVIVADFHGPENLTDCQWIVRDRRGVVDAVNRACEAAKGEYWFLLNDESTLDYEALELLYHEAIARPGELLTPRHEPGYTFQYFNHPFAPFPFAHRELFARLGGVFDPAYKSFYADPDLGMRAYAAGVPVRVVEDAVIHHYNGQDDVKMENMGRYFAIDQAFFRTRWAHLGEFRDC